MTSHRGWGRALALAAAASFVATCYRPQLAPCSVYCGNGEACPDGTTCALGICAADDDRAQCETAPHPVVRVLDLYPSSLVVGASGRLASWSDLSGAENHAYPIDSTHAPPVLTDADPPGRRFLRFTPNQTAGLFVAHGPTLALGARNFLLLVALRPAADGSYTCLFSKRTPGAGCDPRGLGLAAYAGADHDDVEGRIGCVYLVTAPSLPPDGSLHVIALRRLGGRMDLRIDGAATGPYVFVPASETVTAPDANALIGACESSDDWFSGDLFAISLQVGGDEAASLRAEEAFGAVFR